MSSPQFAEWMAYYDIDPWGEQRADLRNAMRMAQTENKYRKKDSKAASAADFLPYAWEHVDREASEAIASDHHVAAEEDLKMRLRAARERRLAQNGGAP